MKLVFCICLFLLGSLQAALISTTQVSCDGASSSSSCGVGDPNSPDFVKATASASSFSASAIADAAIGHLASATARSQDTYIFTVTSGPPQGYFLPCLSASADYFQGGASASASLDGIGVSSGSRGATIDSCMGGTPSFPFTLNVPVQFDLTLSASASAGSKFANFAQSGANATFENRFLFYDSSFSPITGVTYTFLEAPVPEPSSVALLVGGLLGIASLLRTTKQRSTRAPAGETTAGALLR